MAMTHIDVARNAEAVCYIVTDNFDHREIIRSNWEFLGYEYRMTCDMIEYWRHPVSGHVAEMTTY